MIRAGNWSMPVWHEVSRLRWPVRSGTGHRGPPGARTLYLVRGAYMMHNIASKGPSILTLTSQSLSDLAAEWVTTALEVVITGTKSPALLRSHDDEATRPLGLLHDKFIAEAAVFTAMVLRDVPDPANREAARQCAELLVPHARSDRIATFLMRFPNLVTPLATAHLMLSHAGYPDPAFEKVTERALSSPYSYSRDVPSFRALEIDWLRAYCIMLTSGQGADAGPLTATAEPLLHPSHPFFMTRNDGYALTHAVFYATDFGQRPQALSDNHYVRDALDACVLWGCLSQDWDLLAEYLLARLHVDRNAITTSSPKWSTGCEAIRRAWCDLGSRLATLTYSPSEAAAQEDPAAYRFQQTYHPTLVAGLLGCTLKLSLRPPHGPDDTPRRIAADKDHTRAGWNHALVARLRSFGGAQRGMQVARDDAGAQISDDVCGLLLGEAAKNDPKWCKFLSLLATPDADIGIVIDTALTYFMRDYSLGGMARAIAIALTLDIPPSPTLTAAAYFLLDQELPDGSIGAQFLSTNEGARGDARDSVAAALRNLAGEMADYFEKWQ